MTACVTLTCRSGSRSRQITVVPPDRAVEAPPRAELKWEAGQLKGYPANEQQAAVDGIVGRPDCREAEHTADEAERVASFSPALVLSGMMSRRVGRSEQYVTPLPNHPSRATRSPVLPRTTRVLKKP